MKRNKRLATRGSALPVIIAVILTLAAGAWAQSEYKTLHAFTGASNDGANPEAGLISDRSGNLYGTTASGGGGCGGTVFKLKRAADGSWKSRVLYGFGQLPYCLDGQGPLGGLVFDRSGNLYGTTRVGGKGTCNSGNGGCGVVFKLSPRRDGSWTESVLHNFCATDCSDGAYPTAGLIFDGAGSLYGTATAGGAAGAGTVFKLSANTDGSWSEIVLHSFCSMANCAEGRGPDGGLTIDHSGNLYGTTAAGGAHSDGTVFGLTQNADGSWTEKILHDFAADGIEPVGGLVFDRKGNLYGTTSQGGAGFGIVFELLRNQDGSWTESTLYSFTGTNGDGFQPLAGVTFDAAGSLYGTTVYGGATGCNCGVVFKLSPNSQGGWQEAILHRFHEHPGGIPLAGVTFDKAGNLYGTTNGSFSANAGSVFAIMP